MKIFVRKYQVNCPGMIESIEKNDLEKCTTIFKNFQKDIQDEKEKIHSTIHTVGTLFKSSENILNSYLK